MTQYQIEFVTSAAKEFRSLPNNVKHRASVAIDALHDDPRPSGVRKLRGHASLYRIRIGVYRVIYEVDDTAKVIRVTRVRHRREAYR